MCWFKTGHMNTPATPLHASPQTTLRYSDADLQQFQGVIHRKLERAREEYADLLSMLKNDDADDRSAAKGMMEANAEFSEREELAASAQRLEKFIRQLEAAEVRVRTKNYGVCTVTGKLIPKERLLLVPHTTQCVEAKEAAQQMRAA